MMAKVKKAVSRAGVYLVLIAASIVSIFPCYFMFVSAFNSTREITNGKLLPGAHLIENLRNLFATYPILDGILNSLKISLITVVGSLLVSSLAAYGFEKFRTRNSEKAYTIFLIGMMIPTTSLVIPLYRMMASAKLVDSHLAIILPAIGSIFLLFLFRQSFKSLPDEILESLSGGLLFPCLALAGQQIGQDVLFCPQRTAQPPCLRFYPGRYTNRSICFPS